MIFARIGKNLLLKKTILNPNFFFGMQLTAGVVSYPWTYSISSHILGFDFLNGSILKLQKHRKDAELVDYINVSVLALELKLPMVKYCSPPIAV